MKIFSEDALKGVLVICSIIGVSCFMALLLSDNVENGPVAESIITINITAYDACWWQFCRYVNGTGFCMALPIDTLHYNITCADIREACEYRGNGSLAGLMGLSCGWEDKKSRCVCDIEAFSEKASAKN